MTKQIFISHKHDDAAIAEAIASFIKSRVPQGVEIFLSSNTRFKGARFGRNLNKELIGALRHSDALIVVYTHGTKDWSYVMYECGVATDESGDITNTYVFQCMNEHPVIFSETFMVNVRRKEDLQRFCTQLFKSIDFFPKQSEPIAPTWGDLEITEVTVDISKRLENVLPSLDEQPDRVVQIVSHLEIEVPAVVTAEQAASADEQLHHTKEKIRDSAIVTGHEPGAPRIFGMLAFAPTPTLLSICKSWMDISRSQDANWFDACCEHMASVALRRDFTPRWSTIRRPNEDETFVPLITRMTEVPKFGKLYFDIVLAALPDPRDVPVISKMLPREQFFHRVWGEGAGSRIKLVDLIKEIGSEGKNRIPVVNESGAVLYIVHRSLIERFLSGVAIENMTGKPIRELTLSDMVANAEMERTMRTTFAVVARSASLRDAAQAMQQVSECRDVFVTETGARDEPVLGWLTNIDLARAVI